MSDRKPLTIGGNRWSDLGTPAPDSADGVLVSVIIPHYLSEAELDLTLAGLADQNHPSDLIEVIVVDDGSDPPLVLLNPPMPVIVVHQDRDGFGAGRARNRGARIAGGEILLFLDADMIPEPQWIAAHAAWHASFLDVITLGFRTHSDFDGIRPADVGSKTIAGLLGDRPTQIPEWIEGHMERTSDLTGDQDDLFRVVTAGNFGIRKETFDQIGGFDETFTSWGSEDTELGYRAFNAGMLLVPLREAHCWHQGLSGGIPDDHESRSLEIQRSRAGHLIAHPGFRRNVAGRSYEVPRLVVHVGAASDADGLLLTVERVLASRWHDLVVAIAWSGGPEDAEWLTAQLGRDPRVNFEGVSGAASLHLILPADAEIREDTIGLLVDRMNGFGTATVTVKGAEVARLFTTRAAARAKMNGSDDWFKKAGVMFGTVTIEGRDVGMSSGGIDAPGAGGIQRKFRRDSSFDKAWRRARAVRSPRDAAKVARWLAAAVRYRVTGRTPLPPVARRSVDGVAVPTSQRPLGIEIGTIGKSSARIFSASTRVMPTSDERRIDLVVGDTRPEEIENGPPSVWVSGSGSLSVMSTVRAVDAEATNPIGWPSRASGSPVVVPGPSTAWDALAPALAALDGNVDIVISENRRIPIQLDNIERAQDPIGLARMAPYAIDLPQMHRDPVERAGHLVALAASGVVISARQPDERLETALGAELAVAVSWPGAQIDETAREHLSVRQRRAALRHHSLTSRIRQVVDHAGLAPIDLSPVSVLAATNRPDYLPHLLEGVAAQNYPKLELVLALHGGGFGGEVDAMAKELAIPVQVVRVAHEMTLGDALNLAVRASSGTLLTKFDDDDHYGPDHVFDLVLARDYSRAELVGKAAEFVFLAGSGKTIRRFVGRAESFSTTIGGGALVISRHDLDEAGGWRRVPRGVDRALVEDVETAGGAIYRTHGFGYVLVRHGHGHTWAEDDQYFLDQADFSVDGLALEWAGVKV